MTNYNSKSPVKLTSYFPRRETYRLVVSFVLRPFYTREQGLRCQYNGRQDGPQSWPGPQDASYFYDIVELLCHDEYRKTYYRGALLSAFLCIPKAATVFVEALLRIL